MAASLKVLRDRSVEVGECWQWAQGTNNQGYPIMTVGNRSTLVRRWAFEQVKGYVPDGRRRGIIMTCQNKLCVRPCHMIDASRSAVVRAGRHHRNEPTQYLNYARAQIASGSAKLDFAKARLIRQDGRPAKQIAADLGVSPSLIRQIRRNEIWRDTAPNSSVFALR